MTVTLLEYEAVFESNTSQKAFEEDVLLAGFGSAPTKSEGSAISYDDAGQQWTARYQHETVALAFSITEEAEEDGQYGFNRFSLYQGTRTGLWLPLRKSKRRTS